jgi:hypothetical protein
VERWKTAYQAEFGSNPDDDMGDYAADVEAWRVSWQGGYDAREAWALRLLGEEGEEENAEAVEPDSEEAEA